MKNIIPKNMVVPKLRRDINPENVLWLLRNLAIKNRAHPEFDKVWNELLEINKTMWKACIKTEKK